MNQMQKQHEMLMQALSQRKSVVSNGSSYKDPPALKDPPSSGYNYLSSGSRDPSRAYSRNAQVPTTPPREKETYIYGTSGSSRQYAYRKDDIVIGKSVSDNRSDYRFDFGSANPSNKVKESKHPRDQAD